MEEVFRDKRQQCDFEDIEQGEGDSCVEQVEQSRKGASEQQCTVCRYRTELLSLCFQ